MKISGYGWGLLALTLLISGCQTGGGKNTIAGLRSVQIEIKEEKIEGGLEKAMEGYRRFLEETQDSALAPEAIRRLADLKVEREYGVLANGKVSASSRESQADFEKRAAKAAPVEAPVEGADDLERAGAREAIELYKKLLNDYPAYERNDQVLYQMSRAYEELGRVEEAMEVMDRLVRTWPRSRYIDEVQFRRAEYFFTRKRYLDAEEAYASVVTIGASSSYFELALYKLGWTFYKQELYEESLHRFIALLDHKVSTGYDFAQTGDKAERKRIEDTFRVVSLSFSNLGGADSVVEYFTRRGKRTYEDSVYSNLAEFYFDKRRYNDAAASYNAFVGRNPFHKASPQFHMRVIEIHLAGAFPSLVIDAKKQFAGTYGLTSEYWRHFEPGSRPEVLGWLKTNLTDLAKHYHALYQSPKLVKEKKTNFEEALHWYRQFLASFPMDPESPAVNYMLADLLLENKSFDLAAKEYEKTAYEYPRHEKSARAGYAAIYAYREHLATAAPVAKDPVKREVVRSSLRFAAVYPEHEKAATVLGAAADDLYNLRDYEPATAAARNLIEAFPGAAVEVVRAAWLVVGHSTYELMRYNEAEAAYGSVLALLPDADKGRGAVTDNLAASIYKQGEQANAAADYQAAAAHFLRVGRVAPASTIRATAEFDAATALMQLKDWKTAAAVLASFRELFPGHELQAEVTKKIAHVYREDGLYTLAADEYERIERESRDDEVRREALLIAGELHEQVGNQDRKLAVYRRYVDYFPQPLEVNLEMRTKVAGILNEKGDPEGYLSELRRIVALDAAAGSSRTERTRYFGGKAALVLTEPTFTTFAEVRLVKPFEVNLKKKRELMKTAVQDFSKLVDYGVGEVTAAATFYLAEVYAHFSKALLESERPEDLDPVEMEQYELAIEEQAYPFQDRAIETHQKNLELMTIGIYNAWVDRSLEKLAVFMPARYNKQEEESGVISSLDTYVFAVDRREPAPEQVAEKAAIMSEDPVVSPVETAEAAHRAPAAKDGMTAQKAF